MENRRFIWKRIIAYTIDILLITMLVSMLSSVKLVNPRINKYQKEYKEYTNIVEKYQKKKITKKEYNKQYNKIYYILQKDSIYYNAIYLVIIVLYFGLFQFITHGQTVGKKLMKIKLVSDDDKDISISKCIIRSLFLYSTIYYILLSVGVIIFANGAYSMYAQIIYYLNMFLELAIIYLVFTRNDSRGLHDLIAGTKVIYLEKAEEKVIIDAKIEEKKTTKKKSTSSKKTTAKKLPINSKKSVKNSKNEEN